MDESRKHAYETLIFYALVDIRNATSGWGQARWWNPFSWKSNLQTIRRAHLVADVFETVAVYVPLKMVGFEEERFWDLMKSFERRDSYMKIYRERFDLELTKAKK